MRDIPHLKPNTGGGMRCGQCLKTFKSFLRLKHHQANEHGAINEFSKGMTPKEYSSRWKERRNLSEEQLKEEITKFKFEK